MALLRKSEWANDLRKRISFAETVTHYSNTLLCVVPRATLENQ